MSLTVDRTTDTQLTKRSECDYIVNLHRGYKPNRGPRGGVWGWSPVPGTYIGTVTKAGKTWAAVTAFDKPAGCYRTRREAIIALRWAHTERFPTA